MVRVSFPAFANKLPLLLAILLVCELLIIIILHSMKSLLVLVSLLTTILAQCHNNCLLCLAPPVCSLCIPANSLTLAGGCTSDSIPNCRVYASSSICQICQSTYRVVGGACQKDTSGCLVRSAENNCLFCGFGTSLIGNQCSGVLNC